MQKEIVIIWVYMHTSQALMLLQKKNGYQMIYFLNVNFKSNIEFSKFETEKFLRIT